MSVNQGVSVQPSWVKDTGFSECVCFEILYSGSMYDSEIADWLLFLSFLFFLHLCVIIKCWACKLFTKTLIRNIT